MARSVETIYAIIVAEKEANSALDGLTSSSATAIWRLWAWVTAAAMFTVETLFDLFRAEMDMLLETKKPGTLLWYQAMCKSFQFGDALSWNNMTYAYATIDETKKIVKQCSVTEGYNGLVVKVAAEAGGELVQLTTEQEEAFASYVATRKYAGTKVVIVNSAANKLWIEAEVFYNALVILPDGSRISDSSRPVEVAINNYLRNLPFNGRLKRSAIIEAMLAVEGVLDVNVSKLAHKYGANAYEDIDVSHVPESGYYKVDTDHTLVNCIDYNPTED